MGTRPIAVKILPREDSLVSVLKPTPRQQLREAFPLDDALPFLVYDRDSIFSAEFTAKRAR